MDFGHPPRRKGGLICDTDLLGRVPSRSSPSDKHQPGTCAETDQREEHAAEDGQDLPQGTHMPSGENRCPAAGQRLLSRKSGGLLGREGVVSSSGMPSMAFHPGIGLPDRLFVGDFLNDRTGTQSTFTSLRIERSQALRATAPGTASRLSALDRNAAGRAEPGPSHKLCTTDHTIHETTLKPAE